MLKQKGTVMALPSFDVELALREPMRLSTEELSQMKSGFLIEDRSENGWGFVLRTPKNSGETLKEILQALVDACEPFEACIARCKPVLRVAAFSPNATCTVWVDEVSFIAKICASLEVSVYPID